MSLATYIDLTSFRYAMVERYCDSELDGFSVPSCSIAHRARRLPVAAAIVVSYEHCKSLHGSCTGQGSGLTFGHTALQMSVEVEFFWVRALARAYAFSIKFRLLSLEEALVVRNLAVPLGESVVFYAALSSSFDIAESILRSSVHRVR